MKTVKCEKCKIISEYPIGWSVFPYNGKNYYLCPTCTKENCEIKKVPKYEHNMVRAALEKANQSWDYKPPKEDIIITPIEEPPK